ncbi:MAG: pyridoxal 5'-phosphate synthase glutaminase subunit PdxT [Candidatus Micrarchaeia archaeon]
MRVGVIGVQGAVSEHLAAVERLGARGVWVKRPEELNGVSALIIPGGESTTISRLLVESGLFEPVRKLGQQGLPIFGTCAGLILLAKKGDAQVARTGQRLLGLMDMKITRNAFGRQRESFEEEVEVAGVGRVVGVFIRAPAIDRTFGKCIPLARIDGRIVAARQENLLATAFHPELTDDLRIHQFFLDFAR